MLIKILFYRQFRLCITKGVRQSPHPYGCTHPPFTQGLSVSPIITQIGRENKFSAEIFACQFSAKNAERSTCFFIWDSFVSDQTIALTSSSMVAVTMNFLTESMIFSHCGLLS